VVKLELDGLGIGDINNVLGLILFNIGGAEMTIGESTLARLLPRLGRVAQSQKMVENGYLVQEHSEFDRRSTNVQLTEKGTKLRDRLSVSFQDAGAD